MSKYAPLTNHLGLQHSNFVAMTFAEIEHQLGFHLPASSRKHRAWWSNNPTNNVMTKAWLAAGYETAQVDIESEKLMFIKNNSEEPPMAAPLSGSTDHPMFGCLKGMITIPDDLDLTEPAGPGWGEIAYGEDK
ncbi:MAG: hypothetical protein GQ535_14305 [Rhodobacteraceae bacterium]|nr:hypothetical protein [Paracoccaceae bacterium]